MNSRASSRPLFQNPTNLGVGVYWFRLRSGCFRVWGLGFRVRALVLTLKPSSRERQAGLYAVQHAFPGAFGGQDRLLFVVPFGAYPWGLSCPLCPGFLRFCNVRWSIHIPHPTSITQAWPLHGDFGLCAGSSSFTGNGDIEHVEGQNSKTCRCDSVGFLLIVLVAVEVSAAFSYCELLGLLLILAQAGVRVCTADMFSPSSSSSSSSSASASSSSCSSSCSSSSSTTVPVQNHEAFVDPHVSGQEIRPLPDRLRK